MQPYTTVTLTRDVQVTQIPSGQLIDLPIGTQVYITQMLGGSVTLATDHGLVRMDKKEADSLGMEEGEEEIPDSEEGLSLEERVWKALKHVYDPEIPVDIVNLGLVYDCVLTPSLDLEGLFDVVVKMTLTAPGCGMGPMIAAEAESRVSALSGVSSALVELVWEPAWDQGMISEEGKMVLGLV